MSDGEGERGADGWQRARPSGQGQRSESAGNHREGGAANQDPADADPGDGYQGATAPGEQGVSTPGDAQYVGVPDATPSDTPGGAGRGAAPAGGEYVGVPDSTPSGVPGAGGGAGEQRAPAAGEYVGVPGSTPSGGPGAGGGAGEQGAPAAGEVLGSTPGAAPSPASGSAPSGAAEGTEERGWVRRDGGWEEAEGGESPEADLRGTPTVMNPKHHGEHTPSAALAAHYGIQSRTGSPVTASVTYYDDGERAEREVAAEGGRLVAAQDRSAVDTTGSGGAKSVKSQQGRNVFVMTSDGHIYAADSAAEDAPNLAAAAEAMSRGEPANFKLVHHTSFVGGKAVDPSTGAFDPSREEALLGAGEIKVENGKVTVVSNASGHYLPTSENLVDMVNALKALGVDVTQAMVELYGATKVPEAFRADVFAAAEGNKERVMAHDETVAAIKARPPRPAPAERRYGDVCAEHVKRVQRTRARHGETRLQLADEMIDKLALPEVNEERGTHQRHQLRVPTLEQIDGSVMSVGRRQDGRGYDGFGLTTNAHVGVSAEGGKDASTMTLQSNGQLVVRSDTDSTYVLSMGPAVLGSAAVANVVASGGVVIAAGGSVPVENVTFGGDGPPAPNALSKHGDLMGAAKDAWDEWSGANEDAVGARDELQDEADPDNKTEWAGHQSDVLGKDLAASTHETNNALGDESTSEGGGLAFWGEAGFVLGTPEFGAIHAEASLTVSSKYPALVATESLDLSARKDVMLTAGQNVGVYASDKLRIVASSDDLHIATRTGDKVEVWAKAVHLGELEPDDPQEETTLVSLRAKERISFATDADAGRDEGDEGIFFETHEAIEGKAETSITLEAGEEIIIKIADEDYQLMVDSDGLLTIQSGETLMKISDDDGLIFEDDEETYLTASGDGAFLGIDSDNCIDISSSEVAIKGSSIEIG